MSTLQINKWLNKDLYHADAVVGECFSTPVALGVSAIESQVWFTQSVGSLTMTNPQSNQPTPSRFLGIRPKQVLVSRLIRKGLWETWRSAIGDW